MTIFFQITPQVQIQENQIPLIPTCSAVADISNSAKKSTPLKSSTPKVTFNRPILPKSFSPKEIGQELPSTTQALSAISVENQNLLAQGMIYSMYKKVDEIFVI